jgi:hypothetical protein
VVILAIDHGDIDIAQATHAARRIETRKTCTDNNNLLQITTSV